MAKTNTAEAGINPEMTVGAGKKPEVKRAPKRVPDLEQEAAKLKELHDWKESIRAQRQAKDKERAKALSAKIKEFGINEKDFVKNRLQEVTRQAKIKSSDKAAMVSGELEIPESAEQKRWAEARHFQGRNLDEEARLGEQYEEDLQAAENTEGRKMLDAGIAVKHRLDAITQELKTLGYDLEAQAVKPSFWGSLTKKGRLILEYIKLSNDKNYQYFLKAQEDNRRKPGEEADERETMRGMSYRAGGVVSKREAMPMEERSARAERDIAEAREERQLERGTAGDELMMKAGKKVERMLEEIDEELDPFNLTGPDLVKMDSKTKKILKGSNVRTGTMLDVDKLRKEYMKLAADENYKYYLENKM